MAVGRPRLATHYPDGTVRLYELTSGVFVQVATKGTYVHTPNMSHPEGYVQGQKLFFGWDSANLVLAYAPTTSSFVMVGFDTNLIERAVTANFLNTGVGAVGAIPAISAALGERVSGSSSFGFLYPDFSTGVTTQTLTANAGYRGGEASPDGSSFIILGARNTAVVGATLNTASPPLYNINENQTELSTGVAFGTWVDNNYFVGGNDDVLWLYSFNTSTRLFTESLLLEKIAGKPKRAASVRSNGRWIAVAYQDGANVNTAIYEKRGLYPVKVQTINNFGTLLDFTQDGSLLIDAASKKAYSYNAGSWIDVTSTVMANVATGATVQAVSTHLDNPLGFTQMYNNRLADLQLGTVNLNNLYITLMKPTAKAYDPTDNSFTAVVGANEVSGGLWPTGGLHLTNVTQSADGTRLWKIDADDVSWIFAGTGDSARYGLVYDKTSMKPLLHINFQQDIAIPPNMSLTIQLGTAGLISYMS